MMTRVLMKYRYRQEWREKYVSLEETAEWTRTGKHEHRVNAVRGLEDGSTGIGMSTFDNLKQVAKPLYIGVMSARACSLCLQRT